MIRAKMVLQGVFHVNYGGLEAKFYTDYDPNKEEDKSFQKNTPSGNASFTIDNAAVFPQLIIGKAYYFDISQVPDENV